MKIQEIKSPGGIKAWLVEEHSVPLVALRFAFEGGSSQDPAGKEGLANFLSGMLDEGAGDLNSKQFQERMEEIAMRMSFDDGRDAFYGNFETLTQNRERAVELLTLGDHQAALRCGGDRAHAQAVSGEPHLRGARSRPRFLRAVDGAGVRGASLRPAGQRHAAVGGRRQRQGPRRFPHAHLCQGQPARGGGGRHRCRHARRHARQGVRRAARQGQADAGCQDRAQGGRSGSRSST